METLDQKSIDALAQKLWDYQRMNQKPEKADLILVLGCADIRVAERGAQLFQEGWAPLLVFSGGVGRETPSQWTVPEAQKFADVARTMGIPEDKIIVEDKSTNTGENILFTKVLLESKGIDAKKIIAVHQPYAERRDYLTFKKCWPEVEVIMASPQIPFSQYPNSKISKEKLINNAVGDIERIKIYPEKGYQIPQEIPADIWDAYEKLVAAGYTKVLITKT